MSSNVYYRNWQKNYSNNFRKNEFEHLGSLKKISKDINRLDKTIDKIQTEKNAEKIFSYGKQITLNLPLVQVEYIETKYIIINGCIIMYQNNH